MRAPNENAPVSSQLDQGALQNTSPHNIRLPIRLKRLARALIEGPRSVRDLTDVIPSNNPPEYVNRLRRIAGLQIPCEKVRYKNNDGEFTWYGQYRATETDVAKLRRLTEGGS